MHFDYCLSAAGGHTRNHPRRRRNSLRQPLPPTGFSLSLTPRPFQHQWRGCATSRFLEKQTILWILGDKRPVEPTQSRKGAETQRFRLLSTVTCWVNHLTLSFPCHLPVLCVLASWRPPSAVLLRRTGLCVNCRFWAYCPARQASGERPSWALKA